MLFKNIPGQKHIKEMLIRSVKDNRISHAQLFLGPEGCGNLALAIAYAQYINCTGEKEEDSCGHCNSCLKFSKLIHPDLHFIYPVATTKSITKNPVSDDFISDWRQLLLSNPYISLNLWFETIGIENKQGIIGKDESANIIRKLSLKTYEGDYKIMIIWMADKMNDSCANKILKILEEPPGNTLFLMVTESTEQILPTILSRTQLLKIPKISDQDIQDQLRVSFAGQDHKFETIAHMANGNYLKALQLIGNEQKDQLNLEKYIQLMRTAYVKNVFDIMKWVDEMSKMGREELKNFFEYALRLTRENYLMNLKLDQIVYLDEAENDFSKKYHVYIKSENINQIVEEFSSAYIHIERNAYSKIVLLDMALKMFKLINPRKIA